MVLVQRDGEPARCFLCSKSLPGQPATRETTVNGDERVEVAALNRHRDQKLERHRDLLRVIGALDGEPDE
jgi:hypothetical protein